MFPHLFWLTVVRLTSDIMLEFSESSQSAVMTVMHYYWQKSKEAWSQAQQQQQQPASEMTEQQQQPAGDVKQLQQERPISPIEVEYM